MTDFDPQNPLNRIQGESQRANAGLRDYYGLGAARSLVKLVELYVQQLSSNQSAKLPSVKIYTIEAWSYRFHWQVRVAAQTDIDNALALEAYRLRIMPPAEVLARLSDMARGDMGEFAQVRKPDDLEQHPKSYLVKETTTTGTRRSDGIATVRTTIKLYDALAALVQLGKHHGLFTDKLDITWRELLPEGYDADEVQRQFAELMAAAKAKIESEND